MAKWRGRIGYAVDFETAPGVWRQKIVERMATGDLKPKGCTRAGARN